jgi:polysaccharide pyruvyl transferase WcaK-like protein
MTKILLGKNPYSLNKGEVAMLVGTLKTFRTFFENVEFSIVSTHPEIDEMRCDTKINIISDISSDKSRTIRIFKFVYSIVQDITSVFIYRIFNFKTSGITKGEKLKAYCEADLITMGHDDALTGIYGGFPFFSTIYPIILAKLLKTPIVIYAGSIGPEPSKGKLSKMLVRFTLNKVDLITLREEISYEYLQMVGVNKPPIYVTADPAFLLPSVTSERVKEIMLIESINKNDRPLIGVSLSQVIAHWAFPEIQDLGGKYDRYIKIMSQVIDYLTEELSATIVFVPHVIGYSKKEDDRIAAKDIYQMAKNKDKIKLIENEYAPEELKGLIGQFDLFIGARTHSVISAAMMCTPFVAIEYESPKTRGIIGKMLDCEEFVYDIRTLNFDTLITKINDVWLNREKIRGELKFKIEGMEERALLNGKLVKELMTRK